MGEVLLNQGQDLIRVRVRFIVKFLLSKKVNFPKFPDKAVCPYLCREPLGNCDLKLSSISCHVWSGISCPLSFRNCHTLRLHSFFSKLDICFVNVLGFVRFCESPVFIWEGISSRAILG